MRRTIGGAAGLVLAFLATFWFGQCSGKRGSETPDTHVVDSLTAANVVLQQHADSLQLSIAHLTKDRDQLRIGRDVAVRAADSAERRLVAERTQMLPAAQVPDSALREMYALALTRLDSALFLLPQKDKIIRQDSVIMAQDQQIQDSLHVQVATVTQQRDNEHGSVVELQRQLDEKRGAWCQRKCGIVVGVLGTVGAALLLEQVQHVFTKP